MLFLTQKKPRHRRYQPPTLYQLAFNKTCLSLWKLSPLPSLNAESANSFKNDDKNAEDYKEYLLKISAAVNDIEQKVHCSGIIPFRLQMKIMNVVKEIDNDMRDFAFAVAWGLVHKTIFNIEYCMEHLAVTENFTIDMKESICNIMVASKMNVQFTKQFLACYCITKSKVVHVCEQVCNHHGKPHPDVAVKILEQLTRDFIPASAYWNKQRRQDRFNCNRQNLCYASEFHFVAAAGTIDALKFYYDATCHKLEAYEIDEDVYQCSKFTFQASPISADKIDFMYKKMSSGAWKRLLNEEFVNIFLTFLRSWRHRHLCMQLVIDVKDILNDVAFKSILKEMASIARDKYQYHEIMNIIKEFWTVIPDSLKKDIKIAYSILELVSAEKDVDDSIVQNFQMDLPHFMRDYTDEIQEEILGRIIFNLVSTSKERHVEAYLKTIQEFGFKTKTGREYITIDRFKNLIVNDASTAMSTNYEKVLKYISSNEEEETKFKEDLISDKHFIADLLVHANDSLIPFFNWALKEESKINAFKATLINEDFIDDVYQRRLIYFPSFCEANRIFGEKIMSLNKHQVGEIQGRVKNHAEVLHLVLLNSLGSVNFDRATFFTEGFALTVEEQTALLRDFLYLPDTLEAIYDMIIDLENFHASFMCSLDGAQLMLRWHRFIINMVKPYLDSNAYVAMLLRDHDMVVNLCHQKVKNHPKFGTIFSDSAIRMNIELRLRAFSRLFDNKGLANKLQKYVRFAVEESGPFMFRIAMEISGQF